MPVDRVTAIICDYDMPGGSGIDWLPDLIRQDVGPVILLTATGSEGIAAKAFRSGVADYLIKGEIMSDSDRLRHAVSEAVRRYKLQKRNRLAARELRLANLKLEDRNKRLREMTETAHRFVDNVAHEFRSPLTVIQEFASIMRDGIGGDVTPEQTEFLNYIQSGVGDLSTLVDDFLDTSKLKARTLLVNRQPTMVDALFARVAPAAEARAKIKSIKVEFEAESGLPQAFCDLEKAARVVTNLLVNAIKFSPENSTIKISARLNGDDVQIAVTDQGMGIAEDELPKLCDRFHQVDASRQTAEKGFGLGLAIVRDLVWLNLGTMSINSEVGQGSTFAFTLPKADPAHVLRCYAQRVKDAGVISQVSAMRISSIHPQATAQMLRKALSVSVQSLDLLLCSGDDQALFVIGPTEDVQRWEARLKEAWSIHGPEPMRSATLVADRLGVWSVDQIGDVAAPVVLGYMDKERRCA